MIISEDNFHDHDSNDGDSDNHNNKVNYQSCVGLHVRNIILVDVNLEILSFVNSKPFRTHKKVLLFFINNLFRDNKYNEGGGERKR